MKQKEKFERFISEWNSRSREQILVRLYSLTRYAERVDAFFANPLLLDDNEYHAFVSYLFNRKE